MLSVATMGGKEASMRSAIMLFVGFRKSKKQVGQEQVVMNQFLRLGNDGRGHWHFFINETNILCAKPES